MVAGKGKTRAQDAAVSAIESPLLDFPIKQAKGIVFNICGGPDLTLTEVSTPMSPSYPAEVGMGSRVTYLHGS